MDPSYETVVDVADLIWTFVVYALHGVIVFAHAGLACFLLGTGTRIYFIDREGRVIYNPGIGPFGFNPDHLQPVIEAYLSRVEMGSS